MVNIGSANGLTTASLAPSHDQNKRLLPIGPITLQYNCNENTIIGEN